MAQHIDNKRIAKNTLFLYIRTIFSLVVSLYTVRVIWNILGVDNYGIYNVVAGIVMMFQFLNNAMIASSQRFIAYELGVGNMERLQRVFSVSVKIHYILAFIILALAETVGLWFLNYKLNIPVDRMFAANCVYQCSLAAFFVTVISVPYNACIVAHEHMKIYGIYGIISVSLKLVIVFLLAIIPFDKLITYAILVLCVEVTMRIMYQLYCRKHFEECKYINTKDPNLMRDMFSFAGWSFLGNMGFTFRDQGLNIILNIFFNVAMNAAKGIANQAIGAINGFYTNFTMALNPQITKSYAAGDKEGMIKLMTRGCKFAFLLLSVIVIPIFVCCNELLHLWLSNVESYSVGFLRIMLIIAMVDSMSQPLVTALHATGKIKRFQIGISIIMLSTLPLAWLWLKLDLNPYAVVYVSLIASLVAIIGRAIFLREQMEYSLLQFFKSTIITCYPIALISLGCCWLLYRVSYFQIGLFPTIIFLISAFIICVCFSALALDASERTAIINMFKKILKR